MTIVKTIKGCYNMENQVFRSTEEWEEYVGAQIRSLRQDEHLTQKALAIVPTSRSRRSSRWNSVAVLH